MALLMFINVYFSNVNIIYFITDIEGTMVEFYKCFD